MWRGNRLAGTGQLYKKGLLPPLSCPHLSSIPSVVSTTVFQSHRNKSTTSLLERNMASHRFTHQASHQSTPHSSRTRLPLTHNPRYKFNGTGSYLYALRKYGIQPPYTPSQTVTNEIGAMEASLSIASTVSPSKILKVTLR